MSPQNETRFSLTGSSRSFETFHCHTLEHEDKTESDLCCLERIYFLVMVSKDQVWETLAVDFSNIKLSDLRQNDSMTYHIIETCFVVVDGKQVEGLRR